jgi:cbb3-type cytochrome oxidase subunit 1
MMDWFVKAFLKASLVWFSIAVAVALLMAVAPVLTVYRTAHLHVALLGFVTQMIYGVALHVIPRFFGQPLVFPRMAEVQFWTAQTGLALLATGFVSRVNGWPLASAQVATGGLVSAIGAACFVINLWRTMSESEVREAAARRARAMPVMPQAGAPAVPTAQRVTPSAKS